MNIASKYDVSGPRYTSYPTVPQFNSAFSQRDLCGHLRLSNASKSPLSLYVHIPFCATVCFYCACNKIATANRRKATRYLAHLYRELEYYAALVDSDRPVTQLHWGGGTPTFLNAEQMCELMDMTARNFSLVDQRHGEYSIEIDPREASVETIELLRTLGFNRISIGVQDFDPRVQKAVNRLQSFEQTREVVDAARGCGFKSIGIDLIYGLPFQSVESFSATLDKVAMLQVDRLSVFNYAHLPSMFKVQRQIKAQDLPSPEEKLAIFNTIERRLEGDGYINIGMDHFAKPNDELAVAQQGGKLHRNFQGYSTHADCDLIALGVSAISKIGSSYSQNTKSLEEYYDRIERGELPIARGLSLSSEDRLRRYVIGQLICNFSLDFRTVEKLFDVDFVREFHRELTRLKPFVNDGLIALERDSIRVLPTGRLLIRNICMVFDRYRNEHRPTLHSRTI